MYIFRKRKKSDPVPRGFAAKKSIGWNRILEKKKAALAVWLGQKINACSVSQKKAGLILFCLLFGSWSIMQLVPLFYPHPFPSHFLFITHLRSPDPSELSFSDSLIRRAKNAAHWLDSLKVPDSPSIKAIFLTKPVLPEKTLEDFYPFQIK